jgi:ATP-dependent RNA helicase RhlE
MSTTLANALTNAGVRGVLATSSDATQILRQRAQDRLTSGEIKIVVATYGSFARALNIPSLRRVIHYDLSASTDIYSHSSARVGNDGSKGKVINVVSSPREAELMDTYIETPQACRGHLAQSRWSDRLPG